MAQLTKQNIEVNADGEFEVSSLARGYGVSLRPNAANRGAFPVIVFPDGDQGRPRIINGPGYVAWEGGWQYLKVRTYVGSPPAMKNKGDLWSATTCTTLDDRQGGGEGHEVDARGRLVVGAGSDTIIRKDGPDFNGITQAGTYYLFPDGTIGEGLAKPWDLRAYASLELHFQQTAKPVDADGALKFQLLAATSQTFTSAKPEIAGHTFFEVADFGDNGDLHGFLEVGARSEHVPFAHFRRYAVTPPAFAHVRLVWGGTGGLLWANNQRAELRLYGRLR